jgi:hypothetical protein
MATSEPNSIPPDVLTAMREAVRFLPYAARPLMPALATRAGGEPVSPPD